MTTNKREWDTREVDAEIMDFQVHVREVTGGNDFAMVNSTKLKRAILKFGSEAETQAYQRAVEVIKESGHQQQDDTIWCDMDEIITKLQALKGEEIK